MKLITAWDPGDTTGVAVWDTKGNLLEKQQLAQSSITAYWRYLEDTYGPIDVAVIEDFRLFKHRAVQQAGSRMKAPQVIGSLTTLAEISGSKTVLQQPSIKPTALKLSEIKLPSKHSDTHEWDAYLHGFYYMVGKKIIKTPLQIREGKKRGKV